MGRAQSTVVTEVMLASAALIVGMSILAYFLSFSSAHSQQVELASLVNYEAAVQVARLVAYDNTSRTAWLLLRRLDETPRSFFILVSVGGEFLDCDRVYVFDELRDTNGLVCDSDDGDCVSTCSFYSGAVSSRDVMVWTKDGPMPLYDYLARQAPAQIGLLRVPYPSPGLGYQTKNVIVRVELGETEASTLRVYLGIDYGGRIYVVRIYEVNLA